MGHHQATALIPDPPHALLGLGWEEAVRWAAAGPVAVPGKTCPTPVASPVPQPAHDPVPRPAPRLAPRLADDRRRAEGRGRTAEADVATFLTRKGWSVLGQRVRTAVGEIDLLAWDPKAQCLVAVEVKARKTLTDGLWALAPKAQRRIAAALSFWVASAPAYAGCDCRLDLVVKVPGKSPYHLVNAWMADHGGEAAPGP